MMPCASRLGTRGNVCARHLSVVRVAPHRDGSRLVGRVERRRDRVVDGQAIQRELRLIRGRRRDLGGGCGAALVRRAPGCGIRMALGARHFQVIGLVLRQSLALATAGIVIGIVGAATLTRHLEGMLFGLTPLDAATRWYRRPRSRAAIRFASARCS